MVPAANKAKRLSSVNHQNNSLASSSSSSSSSLSLLTINSVQQFIEIKAWLFLTFFICLHNQFSLPIPLSHIKEQGCLRKLIHQIYGK